MIATRRKVGSILVLQDVPEIASLMRSLLTSSGYSVSLVADEQDAIRFARAHTPDAIVISLGMDTKERIAVADRIREKAGMITQPLIVIFCVPSIPEGTEMEIGPHTYLARLADFDQLRNMLERFLSTGSEC